MIKELTIRINFIVNSFLFLKFLIIIVNWEEIVITLKKRKFYDTIILIFFIKVSYYDS